MKALYLLLITLTLFGRGLEAPDNRSQAKNVLMMIDLDYKKSAINGCIYDYDKTSCMDKTIVDVNSCDLVENNLTIKWVQVVPDTFYGRNRACMNEKKCVNIFTKELFGSPMCCRRIDTEYKKMEADLFNLIPVVSTLAEAQKGWIYGVVKTPLKMIGRTKIGTKAIEPPDEVKGNVARVYLYMDGRYGLQLSKEQKSLYEAWNSLDPVDAKECKVGKLILKIQGGHNPYIEDNCKK